MPGDRGEFLRAVATSSTVTFSEGPGQAKRARTAGAPANGRFVHAP